MLYLHGLSTGDFGPALRDLLGEDASGLSASSIQRLTEAWQAEHAAFRSGSCVFTTTPTCSSTAFTSASASARTTELCLLVVIGVREDGAKELLAVEDGYREQPRLVGRGVARSAATAGMNEPKLVDRRRRARRVGRAARRVPRGQGAALLGSQDSERPRRAPQAAAAPGQDAAARDGRGADPRGRRRALERFRDEFDAKYPKARREARQGLGRADRVLRLPRRALAAPTHHEPDRVRASRPSSLRTKRHQGRRLQEGRARDGLQAPATPPRSAGGGSTATSSSPTCSPARSSRTASSSTEDTQVRPTHTTTERTNGNRSPYEYFPRRFNPQLLTDISTGARYVSTS